MRCNGQKPRFINKNTNENERKVFENWWIEATQLYGTSISYFIHPYSLNDHDSLYGENPTALFTAPVQMLALAQMNNDSLLLSKFGIQTDADLSLIIPIKSFAEYLSSNLAEPKAGDLIRLDELGWDRPGGGGYPNSYPTTQLSGVSSVDYCKLDNPDDLKSLQNGYISGGIDDTYNSWLRGPNVYEITERRDDNIPMQINPLLGHIVWYIKCKRFDYSYEPSVPREHGSNQVNDNTLYGKLTGGTETAEPAKKYPQNAHESSEKDWNYPANGNRDSVYGDYE